MEPRIATLANEILPGGNPIGSAIRLAASRHPCVHGDPAMRAQRIAAVTATALAMIEISEDARVEDAAQIVDDAALSLKLHGRRTVPVSLRVMVRDRHIRQAKQISHLITASLAGLDVPEAIARLEAAIDRVRVIHGLPDPEPTLLPTIVLSIRDAISRDDPLNLLDDDQLIDAVERAYLSVQDEGRTRHG